MRMLIVLALVGVAWGNHDRVTSRIVGGSTAAIADYPFMASMNFGVWGIFHTQACGGALITTTAILSSAHCYYQNTPSQWVARLGSSTASSGGTVHTLARIFLHEYFEHTSLLNDVAVIRLTDPAVLSANIGLARLAGTAYEVPDGTPVDLAGWGRLSFGGQSSNELQHVNVNTINHSLCSVRYNQLKTVAGFENWPDVTPDMMCVGILDEGGRDACQGDAGGPVLHARDIIIGIASWGYRCADPFYPRVNSRVPSYTNWIYNQSIAPIN